MRETRRPAGMILLVMTLILSLLFTGCDFLNSGGGGGGNTYGSNLDSYRTLDPTVWSRKTIAYSGYRTGQSPSTQVYPSEAQILQDLNLLVAEGFGLIRLYDASTHAQRTLSVIEANDLDIKVMLGAYLTGSDATYHTSNYAQLDGAVDLANTYSDIIVAVSVGNEVLVDWSFVAVPPADMVEYIKYVRGQITQPVTVNDNFESYVMGSGYDTFQVWQEVDFAAIHTYPYWDSAYNLWDWRQESVAEAARAEAMMDAALVYAQSNFDEARTALDNVGLDFPIVIGETGWQSFPGASIGNVQYIGHPVNEAMYYERMTEWVYGASGDSLGDGFTRPMGLFYFEAFDEPWKESDDHWGLWDKDRNEKYVLSGTGYTAADAVYYIPPADASVITEDTFVVFRDTEAGTGEQTANHSWNAWENGTTAGISTGTDNPPEGTTYGIITPTPASWGWGMTMSLTDPVDLSAFETSGNLVMSLKTTYSGPLEIGFFTGSTADSQGVDVYIVIDPDNNSYGLSNDGNWHTVTIPIADITPNAAPAYGMSASAELDMENVYASVVIADRFSYTGNSSGDAAAVSVDNIRWEK